MDVKTKIIIFLSILALLDMVIPIPFTALMLIYVVMDRPSWFMDYVNQVYN